MLVLFCFITQAFIDLLEMVIKKIVCIQTEGTERELINATAQKMQTLDEYMRVCTHAHRLRYQREMTRKYLVELGLCCEWFGRQAKAFPSRNMREECVPVHISSNIFEFPREFQRLVGISTCQMNARMVQIVLVLK